jgi:hypothetical protein
MDKEKLKTGNELNNKIDRLERLIKDISVLEENTIISKSNQDVDKLIIGQNTRFQIPIPMDSRESFLMQIKCIYLRMVEKLKEEFQEL